MVRVSRGLAVLGLLGVAAFAAAADKSDTFAKSPKAPPVIVQPPPAEVVAEAIRGELDAYARRLEVCTRLRQIALETGDDKLQLQVDELEKQAMAIYQARIARLGVSVKEPPRAATVDRKVGGVDPLKVGPPMPAGRGTR